jgi:hypothetical protein
MKLARTLSWLNALKENKMQTWARQIIEEEGVFKSSEMESKHKAAFSKHVKDLKALFHEKASYYISYKPFFDQKMYLIQSTIGHNKEMMKKIKIATRLFEKHYKDCVTGKNLLK